jgi:hypothetical protein
MLWTFDSPTHRPKLTASEEPGSAPLHHRSKQEAKEESSPDLHRGANVSPEPTLIIMRDVSRLLGVRSSPRYPALRGNSFTPQAAPWSGQSSFTPCFSNLLTSDSVGGATASNTPDGVRKGLFISRRLRSDPIWEITVRWDPNHQMKSLWIGTRHSK